MKYYLVGIKGSGMAALANILVDLGHVVHGVDVRKVFFTDEIINPKCVVEYFDDYQLKPDFFYIIGNSFRHSEITQIIKKKNYSYLNYPEFIEKFFTMKKIGVSGSHGKTTTTNFISIMHDKKLNVLVGDGNGKGDKDAEYFLFEACEYQNNFLNYSYEYLVIMNIDYDHPDFFKTAAEYEYAFTMASKRAKCLICNFDDEKCLKIKHKQKVTFGFSEGADMKMASPRDGYLDLWFRGQYYSFQVDFCSRGYYYDFAASFLVCLLTGFSNKQILDNCSKISFPFRRLTCHYNSALNAVYVDDYAHHPTEIRNVIYELRKRFSDKRIIVVFQPHMLSRTIAFVDDFIKELASADEVYLLPVFVPIRERYLSEYCNILAEKSSFLPYTEMVRNDLKERQNVVVAFLGAGDVCNELQFFI